MKISGEIITQATGIKTVVKKTVQTTFTVSEQLPDTVVIALKQTKGRGRGSHSFISPKGGIYINFNIDSTLYNSETLTASVGLAVMDSIKTVLNIDAKIKWLNDIYVDNKKVAGILCIKKQDRILAGIGVNFNTKNRALRSVPNAASLNAPTAKAEEFISELINNFYFYAARPLDTAKFNHNCITLGRRIGITADAENPSQITYATAVSITDKGKLVALTQDGSILTVNSGDVIIY